MSIPYICLEGLDGSGKTSVAQALADRYNATVVHNPGDTPLAKALREILLHKKEIPVAAEEATLLFTAGTISTMRLCTEILSTGKRVILDRSYQSTYAYQSAQGCPESTLYATINSIPTKLRPGVTFFLDCPRHVRLSRMTAQNRVLDRYESMPPAYFDAVERGYNTMRPSMRDVDASQSLDNVVSYIAAECGWK